MRPADRTRLRVALLALAGLVVAVAATLAATSLVGQHVALSGDPRVPDQGLVPAQVRTTPVRTATTPTVRREPRDDDTQEADGDGDDD